MSFEPVRAKGLPALPKVSQIAILVDDENYSQVDVYAQIILRELPEDPHANLACAWVARYFGLRQYFTVFFLKANNSDRSIHDLAEDLHIDVNELYLFDNQASDDVKRETLDEKLHLIKAWGFGFGSEMASLMGQVYLAEITDRIPIVYWGDNFLYRNDGDECVFEHFFKPFNRLSISSVLQEQSTSIFPPKWNLENIKSENIQKRQGKYSKMSALYYLYRSERLTIADYYAGIINIKPWLPTGHTLKDLDFDQTYQYLVKKYLKPQEYIQTMANQFVLSKISAPFVAVHARGSDKDEGYRAMTSIPMKTLQCAKQRLDRLPGDSKLFLMTDDESLLTLYEREFGQRLVITDSQRSSSEIGVHYNPESNKRLAGEEMLVDMLVASQANCFIGLGLSNPSQLICYLGDFLKEDYILFGENRLKQFNTHLYKTVPVR